MQKRKINQISFLVEISAVIGGMLFTSLSAWCGPFSTDDAEPTEYRHSELSFSLQQENSPDGKMATSAVEYNYGLLSDLQLSVSLPYVFNSPAGQPKQQGWGDRVIGVKYRFMQETGSRPMMAIYPTITTPNGDASKGLGNGGTQIFLPIWMQKSWGNWKTFGGGGYLINRAPGVSNNWYYCWALQNQLSERLAIGGEIFHQTEQLPADVSTTGFRLGGTYDLDEHNHLMMSFGRGRAQTDFNSTRLYSGYVGYSLTW